MAFFVLFSSDSFPLFEFPTHVRMQINVSTSISIHFGDLSEIGERLF